MNFITFGPKLVSYNSNFVRSYFNAKEGAQNKIEVQLREGGGSGGKLNNFYLALGGGRELLFGDEEWAAQRCWKGYFLNENIYRQPATLGLTLIYTISVLVPHNIC